MMNAYAYVQKNHKHTKPNETTFLLRITRMKEKLTHYIIIIAIFLHTPQHQQYQWPPNKIDRFRRSISLLCI